MRDGRQVVRAWIAMVSVYAVLLALWTLRALANLGQL